MPDLTVDSLIDAFMSATTKAGMRAAMDVDAGNSPTFVGLTLSGGTLVGGAGNFVFTAGTGNSRTITFQTTTSGGVATNAVVIGIDQSVTFSANTIKGGAGASLVFGGSGGLSYLDSSFAVTNGYHYAGRGQSGGFGWGANWFTGGTPDTVFTSPVAGQVQLAAATAAGAATSWTHLRKSVTAIADNVATAVLTVTVPNAAHSATLLLQVTGRLGVGGTIGAEEGLSMQTYAIVFSRTPGVNAVGNGALAFEKAVTVAGGDNATTSVALSSVSGAVGATNTFTIDVTIAKSGGSSDNHTCLVVAELSNANASGITFA